MIGRLVLIMIALFAIGVLVLPSTVSLFAGQHVWYDISGGNITDTQIPCEKCHADIYEELRNNPIHEEFECEYCHRAYDITYAYDDSGNVVPGKEAHAASVISCLVCHSSGDSGPNTGEGALHASWHSGESNLRCTVCHSPSYPPLAGGFGVTGQANDTGIYAAHRKFVLEAKNSSMMMSANEACIACHTHVAVKIKWNHSRSLEFNIGFGDPITTANGPHNWTISNWSINGTATAIVWGNTTGNGSTSYWSGWPGNVDNIYE